MTILTSFSASWMTISPSSYGLWRTREARGSTNILGVRASIIKMLCILIAVLTMDAIRDSAFSFSICSTDMSVIHYTDVATNRRAVSFVHDLLVLLNRVARAQPRQLLAGLAVSCVPSRSGESIKSMATLRSHGSACMRDAFVTDYLVVVYVQPLPAHSSVNLAVIFEISHMMNRGELEVLKAATFCCVSPPYYDIAHKDGFQWSPTKDQVYCIIGCASLAKAYTMHYAWRYFVLSLPALRHSHEKVNFYQMLSSRG